MSGTTSRQIRYVSMRLVSMSSLVRVVQVHHPRPVRPRSVCGPRNPAFPPVDTTRLSGSTRAPPRARARSHCIDGNPWLDTTFEKFLMT